MAVWDELKVVLARLLEEQPGALTRYPMPEVDEGRHPPFTIHLASWATATAGELHQRFGDSVDLMVGALPYPPGRQPQHRPAPGEQPALLEIQATLTLGPDPRDSPRRRTPLLPLTIAA